MELSCWKKKSSEKPHLNKKGEKVSKKGETGLGGRGTVKPEITSGREGRKRGCSNFVESEEECSPGTNIYGESKGDRGGDYTGGKNRTIGADGETEGRPGGVPGGLNVGKTADGGKGGVP